jgi:hypothetical protein
MLRQGTAWAGLISRARHTSSGVSSRPGPLRGSGGWNSCVPPAQLSMSMARHRIGADTRRV